MNFTISARSLITTAEIKRYNRRIGKLTPAVQALLRRTTEKTFEKEFKQAIVAQKLVYKGALLSSVETRDSVGLAVVTGVLGKGWRANRPHPYVGHLETGRPRKVSNQEKKRLKGWIVDKRSYDVQGDVDDKKAVEIFAKRLATKIQRKGNIKRPFSETAAIKAYPKFQELFGRRFQREVLDKIKLLTSAQKKRLFRQR